MTAYFTLGCLLEVNPLQTWTYIRNGNTLPGYELPPGCRPDEYAQIPDFPVGPFLTPYLDLAWWLDNGRPELINFGGWWVDTFNIERDITRTWRVVPGARPVSRPGRLQDDGYVITIEGTLHGATCCSVSAGWGLIQQILERQCDPCVGTTLVYPHGVPVPTGPGQVPDLWVGDETTGPGAWRTLFGVAVAEAPTVVESYGIRCQHCTCGPLTRVRVVLRAQPGKFTNPEVVRVMPLMPIGSTVYPFVENVICPSDELAIDPLGGAIQAPTRPPTTSTRTSVTQNWAAHSVDLIDTSSFMFPTVGVLRIDPGASDLRNLRIMWWRDQPGQVAYDECTAYGGISIPWLPQGMSLTIDGRVGNAAVKSSSGAVAQAPMGMVRNRNGGPWPGSVDFPAGPIQIKIEADPDHTDASAELVIATSLVEP